MILADSSLILLILQSRFSLNFGWFRPNLTDSEWFLLILTDSGFKIDYFSSDYCVILSDSEQGCTKIVLSCDPLARRVIFELAIRRMYVFVISLRIKQYTQYTHKTRGDTRPPVRISVDFPCSRSDVQFISYFPSFPALSGIVMEIIFSFYLQRRWRRWRFDSPPTWYTAM